MILQLAFVLTAIIIGARLGGNGRRRFRNTDFCLRTATHSPSDRCNVDDCRGYFGRIMHAGSRRTGLYGEAGRKVIA